MATTRLTPGDWTFLVGLADPPTTDVSSQVQTVRENVDFGRIQHPPSWGAAGYSDTQDNGTTLEVTVLCDWETANSLVYFLEDNSGDQGWIIAKKGTAPAWKYKVRFQRVGAVLDAEQFSITTVSLPVFSRTLTEPS